MITIDIPMPIRCYDCPFVYYILTGRYEGQAMCQALEAKGVGLPGSLIDEHAPERPDGCPIRSNSI